MKIAPAVAIASLASIIGACTFAIGADEPERRQEGEPCKVERDCADGLLCILGTCGGQSAVGGPCGAQTDCANAGDVCQFCACASCSGPSCASFTTCGRNCASKCALHQPCAVDADCDPKAALICDTEHGECVVPDCRVMGSTTNFVCGPPQCADWCNYAECPSECTTMSCANDLANGRACDGAGSTCVCVPP